MHGRKTCRHRQLDQRETSERENRARRRGQRQVLVPRTRSSPNIAARWWRTSESGHQACRNHVDGEIAMSDTKGKSPRIPAVKAKLLEGKRGLVVGIANDQSI